MGHVRTFKPEASKMFESPSDYSVAVKGIVKPETRTKAVVELGEQIQVVESRPIQKRLFLCL